ncbi:MAG: signal peptidase I [Waddliaceae bacterium]
MMTFKKAKLLLRGAASWYHKKGETLSERNKSTLEHLMESLDEAIHNKDKAEVKSLTPKLKAFLNEHKKTGFILWIFELAFALLIALIVAIAIRQMWFELMVIPTGSMRPTYQENDHLTVTKASYGINYPLLPGHFYFDPDLIERASAIIWSGDNLPQLRDSDSTFFGLFPYKKRYIKRLIGKPGDTLYFYGGKIYGLDKEGRPLNELLESEAMQPLEHIPYTFFQDNIKQANQSYIFYHFNQRVGKSTPSLWGRPLIEVWENEKWVKDEFPKSPTYGDWYGINNFAKARLVKNNDTLALEIFHHPTAEQNFQKSTIPLTKEHLERLMQTLYTARFEVKDGKAMRYGSSMYSSGSDFSDIPNGVYEFYNGTAYKIGIKGWKEELPKEHPLYAQTPENVMRLYNDGIDFHPRVQESSQVSEQNMPTRFSYFRQGDLYLMGSPILTKDDPALQEFIEKEKEKSAPFIDQGPPSAEQIAKWGVKVPESHYLVLGDNHAMSLDSRSFGFVPEGNLRGTPSLLIWPPSPRWGPVNHPQSKVFTTPRLIVWTIAGLLFILYFLYQRRSLQYPIFKKDRDRK